MTHGRTITIFLIKKLYIKKKPKSEKQKLTRDKTLD